MRATLIWTFVLATILLFAQDASGDSPECGKAGVKCTFEKKSGCCNRYACLGPDKDNGQCYKMKGQKGEPCFKGNGVKTCDLGFECKDGECQESGAYSGKRLSEAISMGG